MAKKLKVGKFLSIALNSLKVFLCLKKRWKKRKMKKEKPGNKKQQGAAESRYMKGASLEHQKKQLMSSQICTDGPRLCLRGNKDLLCKSLTASPPGPTFVLQRTPEGCSKKDANSLYTHDSPVPMLENKNIRPQKRLASHETSFEQ